MKTNTLTKRIEKLQECIEDDTRNYIGASSIGSDCLRQIWYQYKGVKAEQVPTKFRRAWAVGKLLEGMILDWIEQTGLKIARVWYDLVDSDIPEFKGHMDSVWLNKNGEAKAIIEVKTAKHASFTIFKNKGCKAWSPQYYAQVQAYMGMSNIHKTYILVFDKDSCELFDELIEYDFEYYKSLKEKALIIVHANIPPPKIHGSPLFFKCKMCKFNKVCHK